MSTPGGEVLGTAEITVDMDVDPAQQALRQLSRNTDRQLRDVQERFTTAGAGISGSLREADDSGRGFSVSLGRLGSVAGSAGSSLARVGVSLGSLGATAGAALPLLAGAVTAVQNIAPAGAVAVTALLAVKQAGLAVKLGMVGIDEAVKTAMDPSDPEAFAEALEKLSPEAQKFALAVQTLQPQLKALQQGVQNALFRELGDTLKDVAGSVLPVLQTNLLTTADIMGKMAAETGFAAKALAKDGTLGKAMEGANAGLSNLSTIPAKVVTALGQLAVAGAPAFAQLTKGAAGAATGISEKLSAAFESGALQEAVNTAIDLLKDLGGIVGNVFGTLKNVLGAAGDAGGGAFAVLTEITQTLQDVSGTKGFQDAIKALVDTMGVLAKTVGPLLASALGAVGPVLIALAGPVQTLVRALGDALQPIIDALGPVLLTLAGSVGSLVEAFAPLLPVVGDLIASLLPPLAKVIEALVKAIAPLLPVVGDLVASLFPPLIPIVDLLAQTFEDLAPLVEQIGDLLADTLAPVIDELPSIIDPLLEVFSELTAVLLPVLSDLLIELAPSFTELSRTAAKLLVALGPLIGAVGLALVDALVALLPVLTPLIELFIQFTTVAVENLAGAVTNVIIPTIDLLVALVNGDFSEAWKALGALLTGVWKQIQTVVSNAGRLVKAAIDTIIKIFKFLYDTLVGGSIIPDLVRAVMSWFRVLGAFLGQVTGAARTVIVNTWSAIRATVTAIVTGIRNAVSTAFGAVSQTASTAFGAVRDKVSGAMSSAGRSVSSGISTIRSHFSDGFQAVRRAVSDALDRVLDTLQGLPGDARRALSDLGSVLFDSGQALMDGFIDGIKSKASDVTGAVTGVLGKARDFLPFSPAKEGPFSGKGWTLYSGRAISEALAEGIRSRSAQVEHAVGALANDASVSLRPAALLAGTRTSPGPLFTGGTARAAAPQVPPSVVFNAVFANNGVIGSRTETLAWLTQALDQLRREGRLPLAAGGTR